MGLSAPDASAASRRMATAIAHPNIALVKYWGKQPGAGNRPATPSLSITLAALATRTRVTQADKDSVRIDGGDTKDDKVLGWLKQLRAAWRLPPVAVVTDNDFPTGAGLASSASGFAALVAAVDATFELGLSAAQRSAWARRGSASAARSAFGGFATLAAGADGAAAPLLAKEEWPLEVVIAVTSEAPKGVSSTAGMAASQATSPFFEAWTRSANEDFEAARRAVLARDFDKLAEAAEHSCLKMHALMLSTRPPLLYWNEATVAAIAEVRRLRAAGAAVFFTVDAGPQVKAVCAPGGGEAVARALARTPGVLRVLTSALGAGARPIADGSAERNGPRGSARLAADDEGRTGRDARQRAARGR